MTDTKKHAKCDIPHVTFRSSREATILIVAECERPPAVNVRSIQEIRKCVCERLIPALAAHGHQLELVHDYVVFAYAPYDPDWLVKKVQNTVNSGGYDKIARGLREGTITIPPAPACQFENLDYDVFSALPANIRSIYMQFRAARGLQMAPKPPDLVVAPLASAFPAEKAAVSPSQPFVPKAPPVTFGKRRKDEESEDLDDEDDDAPPAPAPITPRPATAASSARKRHDFRDLLEATMLAWRIWLDEGGTL